MTAYGHASDGTAEEREARDQAGRLATETTVPLGAGQEERWLQGLGPSR